MAPIDEPAPSRTSGAPLYGDRLRRRVQTWWGGSARWNTPRTYIDALHRLREWHTLRAHDDDEAKWRCCPFWRRTLIQKWNGRQFAQRHGAPMSQLYWRGYGFQRVPLEELPPHYVIRSVEGHSRLGVYVVTGGVDILRSKSATPREIRHRLRRRFRHAWAMPIMVEEFVRRADGQYRLPLEYKCHMFGDAIGAIQVVERHSSDASTVTQRCYTAEWEPFRDAMTVAAPLGPLMPPPPNLDRLIHHATNLGRACGTYMRVDFFLTDRGWIFNEFSSVPSNGLKNTPFADIYFGDLWQRHCPDEL